MIALDKENREIKQEVEALRAKKNKVSKQIGALMAQGKKEEADQIKRKSPLTERALPNFLRERRKWKKRFVRS